MKTKRFISVLIYMVMPLIASADNSGSCGANGNNVTWYYKEATKTLTISGMGKMKDYELYVESFNQSPWHENQNIKTIIIEDGVTSIGNCSFPWCSGVTSIIIPSSVVSIGDEAFSCCSGLTSVTIPNSVTTIGYGAFSSCVGLTSITIPNSVTTIGGSAFSSCSGLTTVTIPNSVISIGELAFWGCSSLTSIDIPNSVTSIGERAFQGCNGISTASLDCREIGAWFSGLSTIKTVVIGDDVRIIGESAFANCKNLESVSIGKNVTSIGYSAFSRCGNLTMIKSYIENPYWIDASVFEFSLSGTTTLYVPKDTKALYQNTFCWNQMPNIVEMESAGDEPIGVKCSAPTIQYKNGKLCYSCNTIGAEFVTTITDTDIDTHNGNEVELCVVYQISVYAKAEGYDNSDMVYATLCWIEDDETQIATAINSNIKSKSVLIQCHNGILSVIGAKEGILIQVYNVSGQLVGSQNASSGITTINTRMSAGDIALVKIKNKVIKVDVR